MNNVPNDPPECQGQTDTAGKGNAAMRLVREIYDWVEVFVITITVILLVFTFFVRVAFVDGPSMMNTLMDKESLAVSNLFYTPERGDIVVFQAPESTIKGGVVKRVIATEGQTVDIDFETWEVTVDGELLNEPYVNKVVGSYMRDYMNTEFPLTVPEGHIFVMGDNRNNSNDSRNANVGCIDVRYVFGKVLFRITPFSKFGPID